MARRSGSEKRQRTGIVTMRINPQEAAAIRQIAQKRGESVSSIMRNAVLRSRTRGSRVDLAAVAQLRTALGSLTGAVNKIGSNFNQFAREVNRGREPRVDSFVAEWDEFKAMFDRDMAELRIVCLQALGKEPQRITSHSDED
jgi:mobilization protein NikA